MSIQILFAKRTNLLGLWCIWVLLTSCAAPEKPLDGEGIWDGRPIGSRPAPDPLIRRAIIARAMREWDFFGRQTVLMKGASESIPNVGAWEDDDFKYSGRVNTYWRAVGKPRIYGRDCTQPWSAAFMSYVMSRAGIPDSQFRRAQAHWIYLVNMIREAAFPGRYFVPRRIQDYSPEPGDLICAYREGKAPPSRDGYTTANGLAGTPAHCDLVVGKSGRTLEVIGGNVRNSVSKVTLELDGQGRLQAVPRRPWFLILQNRL